MITAVDTAVVLDILLADPTFGRRSLAALEEAHQLGSVVACEIVWAETAAAVGKRADVSDTMERLGVDWDPVDREAAIDAGQRWRQYRDAGGPRTRMVADFLVASHAHGRAERLLSRDRGFYRRWFSDVEIVDASTTDPTP